VPTDLAPQIETLQPGVKMTLLAEHPALVTPTGIDVDEKAASGSLRMPHALPAGGLRRAAAR
jgi:hypothetical protein